MRIALIIFLGLCLIPKNQFGQTSITQNFEVTFDWDAYFVENPVKGFGCTLPKPTKVDANAYMKTLNTFQENRRLLKNSSSSGNINVLVLHQYTTHYASWAKDREEDYEDAWTMDLATDANIPGNNYSAECRPSYNIVGYMDIFPDLPSTFGNAELRAAANPNPDVTENPFNKLVRDRVEELDALGLRPNRILIYVHKSIGGTIGFSDDDCITDPDHIGIYVVQTEIADPLNFTDEEFLAVVDISEHEEGHDMYSTDHQDNGFGQPANQNNVCNLIDATFAEFTTNSDGTVRSASRMTVGTRYDKTTLWLQENGYVMSIDNGIARTTRQLLLGEIDSTCTCVTPIDADGDGFSSDEDCDDSNPNINPDQPEEPYNGVDDDCDMATLDDDLDQDGFVLANDCDDNNANINPNQTEEPYNGIDDDCDSTTLDDDLDQDGFSIADDCDDTDENINPDAEDIPNNDIDEDCDGMDTLTSTHEISNTIVNIYPNPTIDIINIDVQGKLKFQANLYNIDGKLIVSESNTKLIKLSSTPKGTYLLEIKDLETGQKIIEKIIIGR
jgi:hypothetical protein